MSADTRVQAPKVTLSTLYLKYRETLATPLVASLAVAVIVIGDVLHQ
jgi:hypothetical protein